MRNYVIILWALVLLNACGTKKSNKKNNNSLAIESLYLGQKPPGLTPEPFAPNLVTTEGWEYSGSFSPDLKEFYFLREVGKTEEDKKIEFVVFQNKNNQWKDAVISSRVGTPFIAPDESYLLFDSKRESGYGNSDIYISFRLQDGSWGDPINLGNKINTRAWEACASVTPDGRYIFFNRNIGSDDYENVDIFWVSTQIIEKLRPKQ